MGEWNELLSRSVTNCIFLTWEWQSIWWDAYRPGELWVQTCRDDHDRLIGIAPWFIEKNPTHGRIIRTIGCVDVTDYLDVIVDRDCVDLVTQQFAAYVAQHTDQFEWISLCNLPALSAGYTSLTKALEGQNFKVETLQQEVCPVIHLPQDWETYVESLEKKQRHELRRKLRRTEGSSDQVAWYIVDAKHDINQELDSFLQLMAASQLEKAQFLKDENNLKFFRAITVVSSEKGWLQMSFLTINGQPAACYYNFVYGKTVLVYNSGLLPDMFGQLSPGIVLLAHLIRHAIENGFVLFDFLRGNEVYKYRMGAQDTPIFMLNAQPMDQVKGG